MIVEESQIPKTATFCRSKMNTILHVIHLRRTISFNAIRWMSFHIILNVVHLRRTISFNAIRWMSFHRSRRMIVEEIQILDTATDKSFCRSKTNTILNVIHLRKTISFNAGT